MCMCIKLQHTKVANTQNILMLCMLKEFVSCIPYTSKHSRGKTFAVFADFSKTRKFYH